MMQLAITFMTIGALMVAAILVDDGNRHYMPCNVATWTIWGGDGR